MFALTTLVAVSFSIGSFRIEESERPFLYAVLLWIILVFSALSGLSRSFVKEQEAGTMDILKLSARPQAVFLGKLFFNLTMLGAAGSTYKKTAAIIRFIQIVSKIL